jgi:phenylpropionate dioxygenase-like ring-hydroxylating dioxygenase large terminal subunit
MPPETPRAGPPSFREAKSRHQKVRAAGLSPDYWYAVEHDRAIRSGQAVEIRFWNTSIALFRGADGRLAAIENRCAHRLLKLTLGEVNGCELVCAYHGWAYDGEGRVVRIPHDLFGRAMPKFQVRSFPVVVRYGLVWIFPGDPRLATQRRIPEIPELEGSGRWACIPLGFTWRAHHSLIIDNVSDFTHAYLHRKYKPFEDSRLVRCEASPDRVSVTYDTKLGGGRISRRFVNRAQINTNSIDLCYEYPYQWSDTDGKIKHWCFLTPIDERTTRVFFLFYFEALHVPFTPWRIPRFLMTPLLRITNRVLFQPLLEQDRFAVESEQAAYAQHFDSPIGEMNPAVVQFQELTIRKWEGHLAQERRASGDSAADRPAPVEAGLYQI